MGLSSQEIIEMYRQRLLKPTVLLFDPSRWLRILLATGLLLAALAAAPSSASRGGVGPDLLLSVHACTGQGGGGEC